MPGTGVGGWPWLEGGNSPSKGRRWPAGVGGGGRGAAGAEAREAAGGQVCRGNAGGGGWSSWGGFQHAVWGLRAEAGASEGLEAART